MMRDQELIGRRSRPAPALRIDASPRIHRRWSRPARLVLFPISGTGSAPVMAPEMTRVRVPTSGLGVPWWGVHEAVDFPRSIYQGARGSQAVRRGVADADLRVGHASRGFVRPCVSHAAVALLWMAGLVCLELALVAPKAGAAAAADPKANIPLAVVADSCASAPSRAECLNSYIYDLDRARSVMGLGPYLLPPTFVALSPAEQMVILANLDRVAYGLQPVSGLNSTLNGDAENGARGHYDPSPSIPSTSWASNWAGAFPNVLAAYYFWFFADGPGSGNEACQTPTARGCWGHRHDILLETSPVALMGAAIAPPGAAEPTGYSMVIADQAVSSAAPDAYTWSQATAAGADSYPYDPGQPLTVTTTGGRIAGSGPSCSHRCVTFHPSGGSITLRAIPDPGFVFDAWTGACSGDSPTCRIQIDSATTVSARFFARPRVPNTQRVVAVTLTARGSTVTVSGQLTHARAGTRVVILLRRGRSSRQIILYTTRRGKFRGHARLHGTGRLVARIRSGRAHVVVTSP
jgi:hypothetical protein